jgi:hypothetical protein
MSKQIRERITKYVSHKVETLIERVYLAILDKIFDAENYDDFEMDNENNIFITYSLKRDENIISDAQEHIRELVTTKYRKKLEQRLEEEGYFVEYDDSDIHVYFEEQLKSKSYNNSDSDISAIEGNILIYKKGTKPIPIVKGKILTGADDSGIFDFGPDD